MSESDPKADTTEENDSGLHSVELLRLFLVTSANRQRLPCDRQRVRNLGIGWIIAAVAELRSG